MESTARVAFNERLDTFAEQHPDLAIPELALQFAATLRTEDAALVDELMAMDAATRLSFIYRARFSRARNSVFAALDLPDIVPVEGTQPITMREKRLDTVYERIASWREHTPNGHRMLIEMKGLELDAAVNERTTRLMGEFWRVESLRRLREKVGDDQRVGDVFTAEQIADVVEKTRKDMYRGNLRLKIKPVQALPRPNRVSRQADGRDAQRPEADRGVAAS